MDLSDCLELALELAQKSGAHLLKKQKNLSKLKITTKHAQGIASNADVESEKMIIAGIAKKYPTHQILAEESAYEKFDGEMNKYKFLSLQEWVWIIDPLDGTNNFLSGLDYFAVCISLVHFGEPVLGVVFRPSTGECFYALKGKGSYVLNFNSDSKARALSNKIVSKKLKDSLLVTGFTTEKGVVFEQEFELFKMMIGKSRGIRRMGSAALDMCYVSKGIFDCFWERGLASWDMAAAGLICMEAGVKVTDYRGQKFHPFIETILVARASIHREVLYLFRKSL
jgi:myo-inositol-1(or 4)-monophosphatase